MKVFGSIRWRFQIWYGLLLVAALIGFGFTAYHLERAQRLREIDAELDRRVSALDVSIILSPGQGFEQPDGAGEPANRPQGGRPFAEPPRRDDRDGRRERPEEERDGQGRREEQAGREAEERREQQGGPPRQPEERRGRLANDNGEVPAGRRMPPRRELRLRGPQASLFESDAGNGYYYIVWLFNGPPRTASASAPADVPRPGETDGHLRQRGHLREAFNFPAPRDCVLVGHSVAAELAELRGLAWRLSAAGAAILAVGLAGGWWLAGRAIRPLDDINATAGRIANGELSERIPTARTSGELATLVGVLNGTFARLETAFAQQARFTSDAAHELRTPVSVLLTQAQATLSRERSPAEYQETLQACQRAAQRMRRLIESLLDLARFDSGQEQLGRTEVDLAAVVADAADLVQPLAAEHGVAVRAELLPLTCSCDAERIAQVLINLITNAIHYQHRRNGTGYVLVTGYRDAHDIVLHVEDNGPGIATDDLPHIFERFYRADTSRTAGRAGLGLSICRAIIEAHGGELTAASEPGAGAIFTIRLPALQASDAPLTFQKANPLLLAPESVQPQGG